MLENKRNGDDPAGETGGRTIAAEDDDQHAGDQRPLHEMKRG
jgi:hypothetical protein